MNICNFCFFSVLSVLNTQVLEILQRANVNIASMNVARSIGTRGGAEGMATITKLFFCFLYK